MYKQLIFLVQLQIIRHSFAHLKVFLFLFVKVLYEFRLLSSTSQKHVRGWTERFADPYILSPLVSIQFNHVLQNLIDEF